MLVERVRSQDAKTMQGRSKPRKSHKTKEKDCATATVPKEKNRIFRKEEEKCRKKGKATGV